MIHSRKREKKTRLSVRYMALAIVFLVLCIAFVVLLAVTQRRGTTLPPEEEGYVRTYTVPGMRGEIYDRNGKKIVGNSTRYDLIYEYGAMPDTRSEINDSLLAVYRVLLRTGNEENMPTDRFALEGSYPEMRFASAIEDKSSATYEAYTRFLKRQQMNAETTEAKDVVKYFVNRYRLSSSLYTDEEITILIRTYYEMERVDFGAYASYTIAENVNESLITAIEESNIQGVNFRVSASREYLYAGSASHILGRVGSITAETAQEYLALGYELDDKVGTSGCEQAFESWLRGTDGVMVLRYDDDGNMVEKYYDPEPIRGNDVYLTIDIDLQLAAERALAEQIDSLSSAEAGAVTATDPNTGALLASASYPSYDLTQFSSVSYVQSLNENPNNPWLNRALSGVYAPGSTYKVGAALAALEMGAINSQTTCSCQQIFPKYDHPTCLDHHGTTNVVEAIRDSCNVFFYYLGDAMGVDSITQYTKALGLGESTGLELTDGVGRVAAQTDRPGETVRAAIGQSTHGYTPLQLSVYMSTIVNGGTRYRSYLLDSVRKYYTHEPVLQTESEVLESVSFSDSTYATLLDGMSRVVSENPEVARSFASIDVSVGGKTGTAEVEGKSDYALFSGFAPLESPEIVVSCVIEEGLHGYYAASVVGAVMEEYFSSEPSE